MAAQLISGTKIAAAIRAEVAEGVSQLKADHGVTPGLAVVLVGDDPASKNYVSLKQKAAFEAGITAGDYTMSAETSWDELVDSVRALGEDDAVHGILVQIPLPEGLDEQAVADAIPPTKDVDGLHPENVGLLAQGRQRFVPATPAGIQQMLLRSGIDPSGKHVVVCGRSEIVGKPVTNLLMQKQDGANATVTVCHTGTADLAAMTRQADILIAAMGRPAIITADMVKDGVVVIDVGTNIIDAPERKRGWRMVGDVDFEAVSEKASHISPVPGGVGPMTIAMLLSNTLKAAQWAAGA